MALITQKSIKKSVAFLAALHKELSSCPEERIDEMWLTHQSRNRFFKECMPKLQPELDLHCKGEYLIGGRPYDFAFLKGNLSSNKPEILIEIENDPKTAHDEVAKLASHPTALKILFTVAEWDDEFWAKTRNPSKRIKFLRKWDGIVDNFRSARESDSMFLLLVGERTPHHSLRIYHDTLGSRQRRTLKETILLDRPITGFENHQRGWLTNKWLKGADLFKK